MSVGLQCKNEAHGKQNELGDVWKKGGREAGRQEQARQHRRAGSRPSSKRIKRYTLWGREKREMHTGDHAVKGEKVERSRSLTLDLWKEKEMLSAGHSSGIHWQQHTKPETTNNFPWSCLGKQRLDCPSISKAAMPGFLLLAKYVDRYYLNSNL